MTTMLDHDHDDVAPMPTSRPMIHFVDDDAMFRGALAEVLELADYEVKQYESAGAFLLSGPPQGPGCILLDLRMPGPNGLELQEALARDAGGMPVVFLTGYGDVPMTVKAMKAGAVEFLTKPFGDDVLMTAVEYALKRSRAARAHELDMQVLRERYSSLSHREAEVMALVVTGLLNKQVGFELGISEITVKAHRGQVMRKMKAGSLPELVNMVARLNLAH